MTKYFYSPVSGKVIGTDSPDLNHLRITGNTPIQAIKNYFASKRLEFDEQEKEALIVLSKETIAKVGNDRD